MFVLTDIAQKISGSVNASDQEIRFMHSYEHFSSTNCLLKLGMCVYIETGVKFQYRFQRT